jgi:glutaminase
VGVATAGEVLAKVPLFSVLDRKGLRELESAAREVTFDSGAVVTTPGKLGLGFFVVTDGELIVKVGSREVQRLHAGDYFGEMALIDGGFRSAEVVASTTVTCLAFAAWQFRPFAMAHPEVAWALLEAMVKRLRDAQEREATLE